MAGGSDQEIAEIKQRLALIESRMERVLEKLEMAPRGTSSGGGWWGGSDDDGATDLAAGADSDPQVLELIANGRKIQAIKRYRELTGLGLKEAKDAVDRLAG
jgi:large subunit ribosomal protein L7/L12